MKKNSWLDYLGYIIVSLLGPVIRKLPLNFGLWLGKACGLLFFYIDLKHRNRVYANLRQGLSEKYSLPRLMQITRQFYLNFGQNIFEIFYIPLIDRNYINKFVSFQGLENIDLAFKNGKGVIFVGVHEGSWELSNIISNIISANMGFPFYMFIQDQASPQLSRILNRYRQEKGCRFIQRERQLRQLIQIFKDNESVGMTIDQGGRFGLGVDFFGKDASMSTGALKLALKYQVVILPVFCLRVQGHYKKYIIGSPFEIKKTGETAFDLKQNLQRLIKLFEDFISNYPQEYLWLYKIWKYSSERTLLILSDAKTGHLRQSQGLARIISDYLKDKNIVCKIIVVEVKFRNNFSKMGLLFSRLFAYKFSCQGCLRCFKWFLVDVSRITLEKLKPDLVVSCGSALAPVNLVLSRINQAKSLVIMKPSFISLKEFDLAVIPQHDRAPRLKNIVITSAALNIIDEEYLKEQAVKLSRQCGLRTGSQELYISLFIGGNSKEFNLTRSLFLEVARNIKSLVEALDGQVLVTTSRRTSQEIEWLVKSEFKDYSRTGLLVIANENNIDAAMGGMLGLSRIVVVSPESISMISEAASSKRLIFVFDALVSLRHRCFLDNMAKQGYIYLTSADKLKEKVMQVWGHNIIPKEVKDSIIVREALTRII